MSLSSLYILPAFFDDRAEVVVQRVKQTGDMKLLTVAQDFELHERLHKVGLSDQKSLNMYDWIQGAVDYGDRGVDDDARVLHRFNKRETVLAPTTLTDKSILSVKTFGETVAKLDYMPGAVNRTAKIDLVDRNDVSWAKDLYDSRGFLSRRQFFNPDGKLGLELVYHVDGTPVLEISHMGDKEMYRLLGTHGLPNWILNGELSLMLWWYQQIMRKDEVVYNDDPYLDSVWFKFLNQIKLTIVCNAQNLTADRIGQIKQYVSQGINVVCPNAKVAAKLDVKYMCPWVKGQKVKQRKTYSPVRIAIPGAWTNDEVVRMLVSYIESIVMKIPDAQIHLVGYFTTSTEKLYHELIDNLDLNDHVTVHGNVLGQMRKDILQTCALALWMPIGSESNILGYLLNHYGLPLVTTEEGFRGACVKVPTADLLSEAILIGMRDIDTWRADTKNRPL